MVVSIRRPNSHHHSRTWRYRLEKEMTMKSQDIDQMKDAILFTDGEAYERMMGRWSRVVSETFLDWLDVPSGLRWLDVGCGNGAFTEKIISRCAPDTVMAIDPSNEQLAFARTRPGAKMAKFEVGDAQKLPFGDSAFDAAIMALVLAFLPDPAEAVAEMARVVRPGGWVATYMWDIQNGGAPTTPIYTAIESLGSTPPVRPNPTASRLESMQGYWETAGLQAIETRVIRIPVTFVDFDDFWDSNTVPIGPQGKVIAAMTPDARDQLRARLREQLPTAPDGHIFYESFANAVRGRVRA
jgi:ubiquinone/menaquinone biosynthesis C-methylase UbiE